MTLVNLMFIAFIVGFILGFICCLFLIYINEEGRIEDWSKIDFDDWVESMKED